MAARSTKGRTGRGGRSSGTGATKSSGNSTRGAAKGRGGAQARSSRTASSSRSRAASAEGENERRRKPAARTRGAKPTKAQSRTAPDSRSKGTKAAGRSTQGSRSRSSKQPRAQTSRSTASRAGRTSRAPRASRRSQADPIAMLTQDHRNVAQLFEQYEAAKDGQKKRAIFEKIRGELELHTQLEEEIFYPEAESRPELKKELKEAHGEHDKVKQMLREAEGLDPESGEFDATVAGIQGAVEHHVEEEERQLFPAVQQSFSEDHMKELAQRMQERRGELQRGDATSGKGRSLVGRLMGR